MSYTDLGIYYSLDERWSLFSRSQLIIRDDLGQSSFGLVDFGAGYRINDHWKVGAAIRRVWYNTGDEWIGGTRPLLDLVWTDTFKDMKWINRSRLEHCSYDHTMQSDIRFRNKTLALFAPRFDLFRPYVEEEFFWTRNGSEINQNWLTAGVAFKPSGHFHVRMGYRWVALLKDRHWENRNAIVTDFGFRF